MPCMSTKKGKAMTKEYGKKKGKQVYYAAKNKEHGFYGHMSIGGTCPHAGVGLDGECSAK